MAIFGYLPWKIAKELEKGPRCRLLDLKKKVEAEGGSGDVEAVRHPDV